MTRPHPRPLLGRERREALWSALTVFSARSSWALWLLERVELMPQLSLRTVCDRAEMGSCQATVISGVHDQQRSAQDQHGGDETRDSGPWYPHPGPV